MSDNWPQPQSAVNGAPPNALVVDNTSAGFSTTGTGWTTLTGNTGYIGSNYLSHPAYAHPGATVVDNNAGTASGTWPASTAGAYFVGANYARHDPGNTADSFTWPIPGTGQHKVFVRWPLTTSSALLATNAQYTVTHAGGSTAFTVDQHYMKGGAWQLLGTFELNAASMVTLAGSGDRYIAADAVMVEPLGTIPDSATWSFAIPSAANYRVFAWWPAVSPAATNASYAVTQAAGTATVVLSQQTGSRSWQALGLFPFAPAAAAVQLTDAADRQVLADAMMAVKDGHPLFNSARWTPTLNASGRYEVFARWSASSNRSSAAKYVIHHAAGETTVLKDQRASGGQWNSLGQFNLAPGNWVMLTDEGGTGYVVADAVKFVWVDTMRHGLFFIHPDHLGTPRMVTDANNAVVWRDLPTTEPFGNSAPETDPAASGLSFQLPLAFPGQYRDPETSLNYNYHRDYSPLGGRYVQADPIGLAGGINTYSYVGGNPISFTDPLGLWRNPSDIYDDAKRDARRSGLPGQHNGLQDDYRHCLASCEMARENTAPVAQCLGWANEKKGDWTHNQQAGERQMDDFNNAVGVNFGRSAQSTQACRAACMTDEANNVVWRDLPTTEPFGNSAPEADPAASGLSFQLPLAFPGQYRDPETSLNYNDQRDYSPLGGRYVQSDPIGLEGGFNTYGYVRGNPLSFIDPFGLDVEVGVRKFFPHSVPYARHCFVRFNGNNQDTLIYSNKGITPDPNPSGASFSRTEGKENDSCVRNEMKRCRAEDYDFTQFNCCMCASNALDACGLKKVGAWPNAPRDASDPPYPKPIPSMPPVEAP